MIPQFSRPSCTLQKFSSSYTIVITFGEPSTEEPSMADTPALRPQDYDAWALATPLQLGPVRTSVSPAENC
jgi:hypothetical protein